MVRKPTKAGGGGAKGLKRPRSSLGAETPERKRMKHKDASRVQAKHQRQQKDARPKQKAATSRESEKGKTTSTTTLAATVIERATPVAKSKIDTEKDTMPGKRSSQAAPEELKKTNRKRQRRVSTLPASRPPARPDQDVYVTRDQRKQSAYRERVLKLVKTRAPQGLAVNVFGLGAAIPSACEVALSVVEAAATLKLQTVVKTDTIHVLDSFSTSEANLEQRKLSRIHIQIVPKP